MTAVPRPLPTADQLSAVRLELAAKADGVLEAIARKCDVPLASVLEALPPQQCITVDGALFEAVWRELTGWGDVLFIVHTVDIVLECEGNLPAGTPGQGYFNIHGDSPIGGHIKADRCTRIALVDRAFHGRRSCSVQFLNGDGEAMFKVFVRRDPQRNLIADQTAAFEALWARFVIEAD